MRLVVVVMGAIFIYLIAYSSGYNQGYGAGQCATLPFKERLDCFNALTLSK